MAHQHLSKGRQLRRCKAVRRRGGFSAAQCYGEAREGGLEFWIERQEGGEEGYVDMCRLERAARTKAVRERLAAWNAVMDRLGGPLCMPHGKRQGACELSGRPLPRAAFAQASRVLPEFLSGTLMFSSISL